MDQQFSEEQLGKRTLIINPGAVLDNSNAHEMVEKISTAQNEGYRFIILYMAELEFISSAGVGAILGTLETSRDAGGDIVICNASESILHVFEVLDLSDYLTIKSDETQAVKYCESQA